jgi:hypothetical protein
MSAIAASLPKVGRAIACSPMNMAQKVRDWIPLFQNRKGIFLTKTVQHIQCENAHIYGIHRNDQMAENMAATVKRYQTIKSHLREKMGLHPDTQFIEIVGDSAAYSREGTAEARAFLQRHLPKNAVWVYGYTGHDEAEGAECCVNALVSRLATEENHLEKTIGNLVGFHTPQALEGWGCTGPDLRHYLLVYGDDESTREKGTVFGDDIVTSDLLSDSLLTVEGGIQSFRQGCHFLLLNRPILAIQGLRGDKTRSAIAEDGRLKDYFSAPDFLQFIKDKVKGVESTDSMLDEWLNEYLSNHLLADPKRKDYDTKKRLLDDAWKIFKAGKLYQKLHLFECSQRGAL